MASWLSGKGKGQMRWSGEINTLAEKEKLFLKLILKPLLNHLVGLSMSGGRKEFIRSERDFTPMVSCLSVERDR